MALDSKTKTTLHAADAGAPLTPYEAERRISHLCDGPITVFVMISRAVELAAKYPADRETIANALYDLLGNYGCLTVGVNDILEISGS